MKVFIGNMQRPAPISKPYNEPIKPHIEPVKPIIPPIAKEPVQAIVNVKKRIPDKRQIRSVSLNLEDPFEFSLNEFANRHSSFSTYVKRLIQRDLEREK